MIAIISDIHGNYTALQEVLKTIDEMGIKEIYCLGDVVGYYSQPNECCDELRQRGIKTIIGNHDWYLLADSFCARSQSVNDTIAYQKKIITKDNLDWLKSLPVHMECEDIKMVHGGWNDPIDEYLVEPTADYFNKVGGTYFCSGHTHIPKVRNFKDKVYCNPGAVGQPRDGDNRASFAVWDPQSKEFKIHRVEYDYKKVGQLMEEAGFEGYYYERLAVGAKDNGWYVSKGEGKHDA